MAKPTERLQNYIAFYASPDGSEQYREFQAPNNETACEIAQQVLTEFREEYAFYNRFTVSPLTEKKSLPTLEKLVLATEIRLPKKAEPVPEHL